MSQKIYCATPYDIKHGFDITTPLAVLAHMKNSKSNAVHFVGIGGIGVSALARWFLAHKWRVTGSDAAAGPIVADIKRRGVPVSVGHKASNMPQNASVCVYSSAVSADNPELRRARALGIKPLSYAETVGCLTEVYDTVAIAGSHGKSTTTAMTALAMVAGKKDPNVIVGTKIREFRHSNFRFGRTRLLVLEADEWKAAFHHYHPNVSVVLNIDAEHLDYYGNLAAVKRSFLLFLKRTKPGGTIILNRDDRNIFSMNAKVALCAKKHACRIVYISKREVLFKRLKAILAVPGEHNVYNALAAYHVARDVFKVPPKIIFGALASFKGTWRRMEFRGTTNIQFPTSNIQLRVFDDYAHHPTEIKATLKAFREKYFLASPKSKTKAGRSPLARSSRAKEGTQLICVYQPHQAKRLAALYKDFVGAFVDADALILLPVYEVTGRDAKKSKYTSKTLAQAIMRKYPRKKVVYLANPANLKKTVKETLSAKPYRARPKPRAKADTLSPIVVMMGAGDVIKYTKQLL